MQLKRTLYIIVVVLLALVFVSGVTPAMSVTAQGQDLAVINSPTNNAVVQGTIQITGSADYPSFQFYIVEVSPEPITGDQWQIVGVIHEQPVINGVLETWNTSQVPDGSYTLRLRVVRLDGNYSEGFSQQVVVANAQPIPTDTPTPAADSAEPTRPPTVTPTALPPTPTIVIEQPIVDTPTPRAIPTTPPLEDPDESDSSLIPTVSGFSVSPLRDACFYGGGLMLVVFLFFGFLSALRQIVIGIINRRRGI
jgi:hypothetical protein